jgi:hypothetical protein
MNSANYFPLIGMTQVRPAGGNLGLLLNNDTIVDVRNAQLTLATVHV